MQDFYPLADCSMRLLIGNAAVWTIVASRAFCDIMPGAGGSPGTGGAGTRATDGAEAGSPAVDLPVLTAEEAACRQA